MYLHEIVDHCKCAHHLGLHLEIILLGDCQNLEAPLHYTKDPLDHIPELCMPIIEEFLEILGPEGARSEHMWEGVAIHTFRMPIPIPWDDITPPCKEPRVRHSLGIQCQLNNTGPLVWWSRRHVHYRRCNYLWRCPPIQPRHRQTSCLLSSLWAHSVRRPPSSSDKLRALLWLHAPGYASCLLRWCSPWTRGRKPCCSWSLRGQENSSLGAPQDHSRSLAKLACQVHDALPWIDNLGSNRLWLVSCILWDSVPTTLEMFLQSAIGQCTVRKVQENRQLFFRRYILGVPQPAILLKGFQLLQKRRSGHMATT